MSEVLLCVTAECAEKVISGLTGEQEISTAEFVTASEKSLFSNSSSSEGEVLFYANVGRRLHIRGVFDC